MAVVKMNFLSKMLGFQTNITVCLPSFNFADAYNGRPDVYVPGMKYQVLYLLHGGSGDDSDYVNFTNIVRYADENKIAVIMPNDYNACYTDSLDGSIKYYSFLTEELPLVCRTMFPISDKREDTFIAGLSMGSHGAMKIAINNPDKFAACLCMSGASTRPGVPTMVPTKDGVFDFDAPKPKIPLGEITQKIEDPDFIRGTVNDVYAVAKANADAGKELPKMFFRVGDCDHALYRAQKAEADLRSWGYETKIEVVKGLGHEWDLWDETLRIAIKDWLPIKHQILYPEG